MPGYASHILERYLHEIRMDHAADAAQQYQIALLQQWMDHLEVVLRENDVPAQVAQNIMREFLYGAMPQHAEARMRETMTRMHLADLERWASEVPPAGATPEPR